MDYRLIIWKTYSLLHYDWDLRYAIFENFNSIKSEDCEDKYYKNRHFIQPVMSINDKEKLEKKFKEKVEIHRLILSNEIVVIINTGDFNENLKLLNILINTHLFTFFKYHIWLCGEVFHLHIFIETNISKKRSEKLLNIMQNIKTYIKTKFTNSELKYITIKTLTDESCNDYIETEGSYIFSNNSYKIYIGTNLHNITFNDIKECKNTDLQTNLEIYYFHALYLY